MSTSSSFFSVSNPSPTATENLVAQVNSATNAANAATAATNELLDEYTVYTNTWASSVTIDWSKALTHRITLSGPTTFTFTGGRNGAKYVLEITQDASGSQTYTLPAKVRYGTYIPNVDITSTPNKTDKLGFIYDSTADKYDLVAVAYGF
jgi:hypothetical protein